MGVKYNDHRKVICANIMDELYQKFEVTTAKMQNCMGKICRKIRVNLNKNDNYLHEESSISKILSGVNTDRLNNNM